MGRRAIADGMVGDLPPAPATPKRRMCGQSVTNGMTDPITINLRILATQVVMQALRDARSDDEYERNHALCWLNRPEGRGLAATFGFSWADEATITADKLPTKLPYYRGD